MKIQMHIYLFEMWEFRQKEKKYWIFDFLFEFSRQNCKQKFYFFGPLQIISLLKNVFAFSKICHYYFLYFRIKKMEVENIFHLKVGFAAVCNGDKCFHLFAAFVFDLFLKQTYP